jgi:hypothetical protein
MLAHFRQGHGPVPSGLSRDDVKVIAAHTTERMDKNRCSDLQMVDRCQNGFRPRAHPYIVG